MRSLLRAVVLAAGLGTRLYPITSVVAKPAIKVFDQPLLFWTVRSLVHSGITDLAFNLCHLPESILGLNLPSKFPGCHMRFVVEDRLLGTAGGLQNILRVTGWESPLIVCNGDSLWALDIGQVLAWHEHLGAELTLVLTDQASTSTFTPVGIDEDFTVVHIGKHVKSTAQDRGIRDYVFTGIYIFDPKALWRLVKMRAVELIRDFVVPSLHTPTRIVGVPIDGFWADLGTPRWYLNEVLRFAKYIHNVKTDVVTGNNCSIAATASVQNAILWDNVKIGTEARVRNAIVLSDIVIPSRGFVENAVVIPRFKCTPSEANCYSRLGNALVWPIMDLAAA